MSEEIDHSKVAEEDPIRSRAIGLFTFLSEFSRLRTRPVRSLDSYEKVIWLGEIPREPECWCAAWNRDASGEASEESWTVLKKPRFVQPPTPPKALDGWVSAGSLRDSSHDVPPLAPHRILEVRSEQGDEVTETRVESLEEHAEVKGAWESYVEREWQPWAANDRRLKRIQHVYAELFAMYQRQQTLGEQYEIVLGQGLLTWQPEEAVSIRRHLLTSKALLEFDRTTGTITIEAAAEGAATGLETDMVDPKCLPASNEQLLLEQQASKIAEAVWDSARVDAILKGWVNSVSAEGTFDFSLEPKTAIGAKPAVALAPALILRARGERSYLKFFEEVLKKLKDGTEVPGGLKKFLTPASGGAAASAEGDGGKVPARPDEVPLLFPLPANEAQERIVSRLESQQGVVVQGPPGTGKSHTIVNLICHLLASGRRVLVTSHTARALQVLRKFLSSRVEAVSPLAVLLLGNDRDAMQSMENSVQGITIRFNTRDRGASRKRIKDLELALHESRREESRLCSQLKEIRERDTVRHPKVFSLYEGTLERIAQQARRDAPLYDWLSDDLPENQEVSVSQQEVMELLKLLRVQELESVAKPELDGVAPADLPSPEVVEQVFRAETQTQAAHASLAPHREHREYRNILALPAPERADLRGRISVLARDCDTLRGHGAEWVARALREILADRDRPWRELLRATHEILARLSSETDAAGRTKVTGLEHRDLSIVRNDAIQLLTHFQQGRAISTLGFRSSTVRQASYLVDSVHVDGALCRSPEALSALIHWIDVQQDLATLARLWQPHATTTANTFSGQRAEYEDLCEPLSALLDIHPKLVALKEKFRGLQPLGPPAWHDDEDVKAFFYALEAAENEQQLSSIREKVIGYAKPLISVIERGKGLEQIWSLLDAVTLRDLHGYSASFRELEGIYEARVALRRQKQLHAQMLQSLPSLASQLVDNPHDPSWDARLARLDEACNWRRTVGWVRRLSDATRTDQVVASLDACRQAIRTQIQELAAARAWEWCFDRMTQEQAEHLVAWSKAVKNIGKGTGKQAGRHRRAAQEHMEKCRGAIPAWIMPLYRVAETVRPEPDIFEVAIIDEASQSGPEAALLLFLAKKIVVVGDDKQISPEFVGVDREDVNLIRERCLRDIPHSYFYGVDGSFFDLAEIRYQGRIRLREHFRCMPEIIQFSNNLSYQHEPLIPLKQYGSGRLQPVVQAVHVPDGYRAGSGNSIINPPEAQAIVTKVTTLCEDPAYRDKTIGVISLQGDRQAQHIESLLMERVGPDGMSAHDIVCGDAYAFQGDERDIIVLSLVAAPDVNHRIGTLTGTKAEQRFNVAASRAREQMILFHTATLTDLSPSCVRSRLLEYCQKPSVQTLSVGDFSVDKLQRMALEVDRAIVKAPKPFDSWFEVDVFLGLATRGYRVVPQVEVAGYFVDLVVDGMTGRLGVECDGDCWHGPDRYEADRARERVLERCGWKIQRIRGGAFYLDPETCFVDLERRLHQSGIFVSSRETPPDPKISGTSRLSVASEPSPAVPTAASGADPHQETTTQPQPVLTRVVDLTEWKSRERVPFESETLSEEGESTSRHSVLPLRQPSDDDTSDSETRIAVAEYELWRPSAVPDPRTCSPSDLLEPLTQLVTAEGPVVVGRVIRLLGHAAGVQRVREGARATLERAVRLAVRRGIVSVRDESRTRDYDRQVLRMPNSPVARIRTGGDRSFEEIPPSEVAALMKALSQSLALSSQQDLFRAVLAHFGIRRLGHGLEDQLIHIWRRLDELSEPTSRS